jgi:hypothetical protein
MAGTDWGFAEFDHLALIFANARAVLDEVLATGDVSADASQLLATETLPHIEDVEAGFHARLRAAETGMAEMRMLVQRAGMVAPHGPAESRAALIEQMQAISGAGGDRHVQPASTRRMAALHHARVVLALIPDTRSEDVHFPGLRSSYADIPVPRGAVEFVERVEEIERVLWRIAAGTPRSRHDGAYRRVYGFFDVGERLTGTGFRLN